MLTTKEIVDRYGNDENLKEDVLKCIYSLLQTKGRHIFSPVYEDEGRRRIVSIDRERAYGEGRDCSYPLKELSLLDIVVIYSEINTLTYDRIRSSTSLKTL